MLGIVDLNDKGQFLQLEYAERLFIRENSVGFRPVDSDDHLIVVSLNNEGLKKDYNIYMYSFSDKPPTTNQTTNQTRWKHSQIYDIEIPKSLNEDIFDYCFVYQTKLFLILGCRSMIQWNLSSSTMSFDMQYFFDYEDSPCNVVINKNKTLLALLADDKYVDIFSMETGTRISRYEGYEG